MRSDRNPVFAISIAVSLFAHAAAAWLLSERTSVRRVDFGEEKVVAVRLFQPAPPAPVAAPPPQPIETPPPRPTEKPIAKEPEPTPEPAQVADARPEEDAPIPPELPAVSAAVPTPEPAPAVSAAVPTPEPAPAVPEGVDRDERAEYVHYVGGLVKGQRRYPRLARKRKITGEVLVEIEIGPDGDVAAIRPVSDSPRVLLRATEEAIRRAAPFRSPPGGSIAFRLPLAYDLQ